MTGKARTKKNETVSETNARARKLASKASAVAKPSAAEVEKPKRIRGDFSMPAADYALIAALKETAKSNGRPVKKNELLRAGLHALKAMTNTQLLASLAAMTSLGDAAPLASKAAPASRKKPARSRS